jgi:vacuolar-type H+-ATPase subunit H
VRPRGSGHSADGAGFTLPQALVGVPGMVDDALKRLLNAELEAERIVAAADEQRQAIIEQAKHDARAQEQQFAERAAQIHASFHEQAEQRAQQTIAEIHRRYEEKEHELRASAKLHEQQAVDEAVALITGENKQ